MSLEFETMIWHSWCSPCHFISWYSDAAFPMMIQERHDSNILLLALQFNAAISFYTSLDLVWILGLIMHVPQSGLNAAPTCKHFPLSALSLIKMFKSIRISSRNPWSCTSKPIKKKSENNLVWMHESSAESLRIRNDQSFCARLPTAWCYSLHLMYLTPDLVQSKLQKYKFSGDFFFSLIMKWMNN